MTRSWSWNSALADVLSGYWTSPSSYRISAWLTLATGNWAHAIRSNYLIFSTAQLASRCGWPMLGATLVPLAAPGSIPFKGRLVESIKLHHEIVLRPQAESPQVWSSCTHGKNLYSYTCVYIYIYMWCMIYSMCNIFCVYIFFMYDIVCISYGVYIYIYNIYNIYIIYIQCGAP